MHVVWWLLSVGTQTGAVEAAFAHADAAEALAAGQSIALRSTIDGSGDDDDHVTAIATLRFPGGGKAVVKSITSITKGGKLMSEEEKARVANNDPIADVHVLSPFLRSERSGHRFDVVSSTATETTIRFAPLGEAAAHLNEGTAVVNTITGAPVRITLSPTKTPMFISTIVTELVFDPNTIWPVPTTMTTVAEGGVLFIKKTVRSSSTYSRRPTAGEAL